MSFRLNKNRNRNFIYNYIKYFARIPKKSISNKNWRLHQVTPTDLFKIIKNDKEIEEIDPSIYLDFLKPDIPENDTNRRFLSIGILGAPNAGKSSLFNTLIKHKVSAVSPKYNTTRQSVTGIITDKNTQLCFYDTPGMTSKFDNRYFSNLVKEASSIVNESNVLLWIVDAARKFQVTDYDVIKLIVKYSICEHSRLFLALNKIDLVKDKNILYDKSETLYDVANDARKELLELESIKEVVELNKTPYEEEMNKRLNPLLDSTIKGTFFISALHDKGISSLINTFKKIAPIHKWEYSSDKITTLSGEDMIKEIIREKIYRNFHHEIPYKVDVRLKMKTKANDGTIEMNYELIVDSESLVKKLSKGLPMITKTAMNDILKESSTDKIKLILQSKYKKLK